MDQQEKRTEVDDLIEVLCERREMYGEHKGLESVSRQLMSLAIAAFTQGKDDRAEILREMSEYFKRLEVQTLKGWQETQEEEDKALAALEKILQGK